MRTILRLTALLVGLGAAGWWLATGRNTGWTKTSVVTYRLDPVTEINEPVWQKRFVPGVDFLAGSALAATVFFGASFFCRRKHPLAAAPSSPALP